MKAFTALLLVTLGTPALAQPAAPHAGMADQSGMMSAMDQMSRDMAAVPMTGDSDRDFAAMMVPHHQGAIGMARSELAHGKDPAMLRLARDVVKAQEREIAMMQSWLAKHPAR